MIDGKEKHSIILVEWVDSSHAGHSGWMDLDKFEKWAEQLPVLITSAGILVYECENHIVLALSAQPEQVSNILQIPRCAIVKMRTLSEVEI